MNTYTISALPFALSLAFVAQAADADLSSRANVLSEAAAGRAQAVESALVTLSAATPCDLEACIALAHLREQQKRSKEAIPLLETVIAAQPQRSMSYIELGSALAQRMPEVSFLQQAILASKMKTAYEKAVTLDPNNIWGWFGLAEYCAQAPAIAGGSMEKAEKFAHEIEKRDPFFGAMELGSLFLRENKLPDAVQQYTNATTLKPENSQSWSSLGQAQAKSGDASAARVSFNQALRLDANNRAAQDGIKSLP